jgi:hypothetical protein
MKLEPPIIDKAEDPTKSLLGVERLPWPSSVLSPLADALLAEIDAIPKPKKGNSKSYEPNSYVPSEKPGVTQDDVFKVFGLKARVILTDHEIEEALGDEKPVESKGQPGKCAHCDKDNVPAWRRGGKIVSRRWPDGRTDWCCSFCGRAILVL